MNSKSVTANAATTDISDSEWQIRQDLAACYRLFVKFGWTDSIFTHLTARVPDQADHYLINPYGLLFQEINASNLLKVDFDGNVISGDYPYNNAGHAIHSAVLKARPDINVVLHSHTRAGIAVSCMQERLLPLSQQAGEVIGLVAYHEYGLADEDNPDECERLGRDMSDKWLMIMNNHGLLGAGRTVAEAFYYLYTLENACKVQVDFMATGATAMVPSADSQTMLAKYGAPPSTGPVRQADLMWEAECRLLKKSDLSWME